MATVTVAEYLFTRLKQCGLKTMFGVPGDYNLQLLDHVEPQGLKWVGNCNELNAGYAADGYARIAGIGSLITTFGVGELSAINAVAGAFTERAPVVHIVGTPPRKTRTDKLFVHHSMGDGDYLHFAEMYKHVTVAQARLWDLETAPEEIDQVLKRCLEEHRPVYISLPDDMVNEHIKSDRLSQQVKPDPVEGDVPQLLLDRVCDSKNPAILIDGECFGVTDQINQLVETTGWLTFVTAFGKSIVNETLPNYHGIWSPGTKKIWHDCDLILCFGPHFSNTNSYNYSVVPDSKLAISIAMTGVSIEGQQFKCSMSNVLESLIQLDANKRPKTETISKAAIVANRNGDLITQVDFYRTISASGLFKSDDKVLAETGTASLGSREFDLPNGTLLFNHVTWLSIGYMLPAALGAALAKPGRTILFIGDGSFQMTAQEISVMIREKLDFLLILINNDGYTIERCIHGKDEKYNDVPRWKYLEAPSFFGGGSTDYPVRTASARKWGELEQIVESEKHAKGPAFSMVEVFMSREDAPEYLIGLLKAQYPNGVPEGFPSHVPISG